MPILARKATEDLGEQGIRAEVDWAKEYTSLVQTNLAKIEKAKTGKPITLVGFRAQARGGPVPGRGLFYSAVPRGAQPFGPYARHYLPQAKMMSVVKLKNPRVVYSATQPELMEGLLSQRLGDVDLKLRRAGR